MFGCVDCVCFQIIATILRALKVDTPPQQFALVTLSDYILNDNAPLVIYGLGSLLQNWQLKLVRTAPYILIHLQ
jgi:hypothetical protein